MADHVRGIAFPLYQRVATERARQGWTWTRLTARAGVARSTINSWAHIPTPPQPEKVNAVADLLGIPRLEALQLAGILGADEPGEKKLADLIPECRLERHVLRLAVSDEAKMEMILGHRIAGHDSWCRGEADAGKDAAGLAAASLPA